MWGILALTFGPATGLAGLVYPPLGFRLLRICARLMLASAGIEVEVIGGDSIADARGTIFASNHHSYVDILSIIAGFPVDVYFVYKKSLLILPGLNVALLGQRHIMVSDKKASGSAKKMLKLGKKYLDSGKNIVIFPGGGLSVDESVGEFKGGAAALAIFTGAKLVPF